jgi:hypothetical protein
LNIIQAKGAEQNFTWSLYNENGTLLLQKEIQSNDNQVDINLQHLPNGIYFWQASSPSLETKVGKIILIK